MSVWLDCMIVTAREKTARISAVRRPDNASLLSPEGPMRTTGQTIGPVEARRRFNEKLAIYGISLHKVTFRKLLLANGIPCGNGLQINATKLDNVIRREEHFYSQMASVEKAAEVMGLKVRTIYDQIREGKVPGHRKHSRFFVPNYYLNQHTSEKENDLSFERALVWLKENGFIAKNVGRLTKKWCKVRGIGFRMGLNCALIAKSELELFKARMQVENEEKERLLSSVGIGKNHPTFNRNMRADISVIKRKVGILQQQGVPFPYKKLCLVRVSDRDLLERDVGRIKRKMARNEEIAQFRASAKTLDAENLISSVNGRINALKKEQQQCLIVLAANGNRKALHKLIGFFASDILWIVRKYYYLQIEQADAICVRALYMACLNCRNTVNFRAYAIRFMEGELLDTAKKENRMPNFITYGANVASHNRAAEF